MLPMIYLLVLLLLVILLLFSLRSSRPLPFRPTSRVLLVIAHPDDETMFFAPVIRALRVAGHRLFIICISNGNFHGQGYTRSGELRNAAVQLGLSAADVTVLNYDAFPDGSQWDKNLLSHVIMRHVEVLSADCVFHTNNHNVLVSENILKLATSQNLVSRYVFINSLRRIYCFEYLILLYIRLYCVIYIYIYITYSMHIYIYIYIYITKIQHIFSYFRLLESFNYGKLIIFQNLGFFKINITK
uniref:N-acetylglucosaminylphosphatidylinositol deacetylase n=1 Tax=Heterorhabditis bacteriophora TaxID=37862 RepID=A0A1I7X2R5_HETBA